MASLLAQRKESSRNAGDPIWISWVGKIPWRRDRLPAPVFLGFPSGSDGKESTCNVGDLGWEDPLKEGMATHSSRLAWRIPMDREAWQGYSPWNHKELDMTERLSTHYSTPYNSLIYSV